MAPGPDGGQIEPRPSINAFDWSTRPLLAGLLILSSPKIESKRLTLKLFLVGAHVRYDVCHLPQHRGEQEEPPEELNYHIEKLALGPRPRQVAHVAERLWGVCTIGARC